MTRPHRTVALKLTDREGQALGYWLQAEWVWADALDRDALALTKEIVRKVHQGWLRQWMADPQREPVKFPAKRGGR